MREIKFRAFWKDTLKPVDDFNSEFTIDACNDDSFIIQQFIGLKDKNGKEIYEGDIIKYNRHGYTSVWKVYWSELHLRYDLIDLTGEYCVGGMDACHGDYEVIGNIYENPELLNGDEK